MTIAAVILAGALLTLPRNPRLRMFRISSGCVPRIPAALPPAIVALALAITTTPALALVGTAATAMVQVRRRRARLAVVRRTEADAMTTALETIIGELRVGAHPLRAFGIAASESSGAVGAALQTVAARVAVGADVVVGLHAVGSRSAVPVYWERIAVCWRLASEHGLPMAALMRAAQGDIVERQRFSARVQAGLAGARATATILAGLPLLGILLGQLIGAHPIRFLLGGGVGGWLLIAGAALVFAGVLWSGRIVDRLTT